MPAILEKIKNIVGDAGIVPQEVLSGRSAGIWDSSPLQALALVRPKTTEEVASVLQACNQVGQTVIPVGGMTGLTGAHRSSTADIILSLERMNTIEELDSQSRTMTVGAGAILQNVQEKAGEAGLMFTLDLGARASCTIGGNIATNAGGIRVLRCGMMREQVLGLEAVLANGSIISSMFKLLKNNTGYDLKQLFLGSEGSLGVVTKAVLRLHEAPLHIETAILAVPGWDQVMTLLREYDSTLNGQLAAFEVLWQNYYDLNTGSSSELDPPLPEPAPYYVLIDVFVSDDTYDRSRLEKLLMQQLENGQIVDGILANSENERHKFWQIRENFDPEQKKFGLIYGYDISLPIAKMPNFVDSVTHNLKSNFPDAELFSFGHIGDGNLHFSVAPGAAQDRAAIDQLVYPPLQKLKGSVSAEHGIGLDKKPYLAYTRSEAEIELMRQIKRTMDPKGILNPGKLFD